MSGTEGVVAAAAAALAEQRARLAETERLLAALPGIERDGRLGSRPVPGEQLELVHGAAEQWRFWLRVIADPPSRPAAVFPDFTAVMSLVLDNLGAEASKAIGDSGVRSRVLTHAGQLVDAAVREQIGAFATLGIEIRTSATLPGFFLVDPDGLAVVPLEWGQAVPTTIAVSRDPAVVAAIAASFEDLWDDAQPLPGVVHDWDPVLGLMAQGLSDGAIATALGHSLRTVRRRIAEAADAHGVSTRFELGMAWAGRD